MNSTDLVLCKAVATEVFPDRGWIGVVVKQDDGVRKVEGVFTRPELYRKVRQIMVQNGEESVRKAVSGFKVPPCYSLMFASAKDAYDGNHARKLIESIIKDG